MEPAAAAARDMELLVANLEAQLARDRVHKSNLEESLARHERRFAELRRDAAAAEAITSLDDLSASGRHVHRALVDKLRIKEAALRGIIEDESTAQRQIDLLGSTHRARRDAIRSRLEDVETRSRDLDVAVVHDAAFAAHLRDFNVLLHRRAREREVQLAQWHLEHRRRAHDARQQRHAVAEQSLREETGVVCDCLAEIVQAKADELAATHEALKQVDDLFEQVGAAVQSSRVDVDAIAVHEVRRATLTGELEAIRDSIGAIEEDITRLTRRMDEKDGQVELASSQAVSERSVDDRLAAIVSSLDLLKRRRLELHRRTSTVTEARKGQLDETDEMTQFRHSIVVLEDERTRYVTERRAFAAEIESLDAKNRRLADELQRAAGDSERLTTHLSEQKLSLQQLRYKIDEDIEATTRRTAQLLADLTAPSS
jgi:hypothetical protein